MENLINKYANALITKNQSKIFDEIIAHDKVLTLIEATGCKYPDFTMYTVLDTNECEVFKFYIQWPFYRAFDMEQYEEDTEEVNPVYNRDKFETSQSIIGGF